MEPPKDYRIKQGSSKELGYQLKGDLSHMYRFLIRQIIEDIHPQRNIYIQDGAKKKRTRYPKGSHKYIQTRLLLKSIAHSSNLSHCI